MKAQTVKWWATPIAAILLCYSNLMAQEGKISGYIFGDYYYEFSHPNAATDKLDRNGFQFRRAYFTYDRDLSAKFSVRFRLEMNSPDLTRVQDFGTSTTLNPYIKHAYLRWNNIIPQGRWSFGLISTPTFNMSEEVWGYRAVEKTIMDLRRIAPSSELGMTLEGKFVKSGVLNYQILVGNGTSTSSETDKNKRVYVNIPVKIEGIFFFVPYADYEGGNDGRDKYALALFTGLQQPRFHGGVEAFQKKSNNALTVGPGRRRDRTEIGLSAFGAIKAVEKVKLFGRIDIYDPDTDTDDDGNLLIISGVDFLADKNVNVIPNVRIESYQASDADANILGLLTFYFRF